jgi:N-methylhydantoinase A/oxoprolinase/acetone carboxylase beta subunit
VIEGPAIVEERDSTTVVPPGWEARVAAHGILALGRRGAGAASLAPR